MILYVIWLRLSPVCESDISNPESVDEDGENIVVNLTPIDYDSDDVLVMTIESSNQLLISESENNLTRDKGNYYVVQPSFRNINKTAGSKKVPNGFIYSSGTNKRFLSILQIKKLLKTK